jgi:hypothetical protein
VNSIESRVRDVSLDFCALGLSFRKVGPGTFCIGAIFERSFQVDSETRNPRVITFTHFPNVAPADFPITFTVKRKKIRGCFTGPTDCD